MKSTSFAKVWISFETFLIAVNFKNPADCNPLLSAAVQSGMSEIEKKILQNDNKMPWKKIVKRSLLVLLFKYGALSGFLYKMLYLLNINSLTWLNCVISICFFSIYFSFGNWRHLKTLSGVLNCVIKIVSIKNKLKINVKRDHKLELNFRSELS